MSQSITVQNLPTPPSEEERISYFDSKVRLLYFFQLIGFFGVAFSLVKFSLLDAKTLWFFIPATFLIAYFLVGFYINLKGYHNSEYDFFIETANTFNKKKEGNISVDIFLPTAGEPIEILENTYKYVSALEWGGMLKVHVLDDDDRMEVKNLAIKYKFNYIVRDDRGVMKKAGNLRNAYNITSGKFIVIFDADFVPRSDFLTKLIPYFNDKKIGIVQSPQFFRSLKGMNWLEKGAGEVQELFYRLIQSNRSKIGAPICVGSCAIYRRKALVTAGGFAYIEHSEDVHTGFALMSSGYKTKYVPMPMSTGLCPDNLKNFFNQQYRWAAGSMSLMRNKKFWETDLTPSQRLCFVSGFMYYLFTASWQLFFLVPVSMLGVFFPENVLLRNYLPLIPSLIYGFIILPYWHRVKYGTDAKNTKIISSFAHLAAIIDVFRNNLQGWVPTGGKPVGNKRFRNFRILNLGLIAIPSISFILLAFYRVVINKYPIINWTPMVIFLGYQAFMSLRIEVKINKEK